MLRAGEGVLLVRPYFGRLLLHLVASATGTPSREAASHFRQLLGSFGRFSPFHTVLRGYVGRLPSHLVANRQKSLGLGKVGLSAHVLAAPDPTLPVAGKSPAD